MQIAVPDVELLVELPGGVFVEIHQDDLMRFDLGTPEKGHIVAKTDDRLRKGIAQPHQTDSDRQGCAGEDR